MPARLLDRPSTRSAPTTPRPAGPAAIPDPGYEALSRLARLRADLAAVLVRPQSRWKEPALFFFDNCREAQREANRLVQPPDPFADISVRIAAELPVLSESVEARRVARTIEGLRATAEALAPQCVAAKDLADLLAIPDDEVVLVLHPELRTGFRMTVRGVADVGQFHVLMAAAISSDPNAGFRSGPAIPDRFVAACRNMGPSIPAGVPMVMEARFQLYTAAAIRPDGMLPTGFGGCDCWLWPTTPLAAIPRVGGERVMLLGPPAYRANWDVCLRFPGMRADLRVVEALGPFRVAEELTRLTGKPILPIPRQEQEKKLSKAA
ncbi:MAG TPA: hypothetical protein VG122_03550 [Gemmata sp.]|nr:hypothetical protein [Gemmata sp.]